MNYTREEKKYLKQIRRISKFMYKISENFRQHYYIFTQVRILSISEYKSRIKKDFIVKFNLVYDDFLKIEVPKNFKLSYEYFSDGMKLYLESSKLFQKFIDSEHKEKTFEEANDKDVELFKDKNYSNASSIMEKAADKIELSYDIFIYS
ncbi:hypothetical protein KJ885_06300 [Patescibacteria group bacterium]|nr:hypothetical protein [Patescibacteria group bacterium]